MHVNDNVKNYRRLVWSTEACWQISRLPINLNADRSMNESQDIIIVTKEGILTHLKALSHIKCT